MTCRTLQTSGDMHHDRYTHTHSTDPATHLTAPKRGWLVCGLCAPPKTKSSGNALALRGPLAAAARCDDSPLGTRGASSARRTGAGSNIMNEKSHTKQHHRTGHLSQLDDINLTAGSSVLTEDHHAEIPRCRKASHARRLTCGIVCCETLCRDMQHYLSMHTLCF